MTRACNCHARRSVIRDTHETLLGHMNPEVVSSCAVDPGVPAIQLPALALGVLRFSKLDSESHEGDLDGSQSQNLVRERCVARIWEAETCSKYSGSH